LIERNYSQEAASGPTSFTVRIPKPLHSYYKNRTRVDEYGSYVSDMYDDQYLKTLVDEFERFTTKGGGDDVDTINHMMSFVQNLEYTKDRVGTGYNEYPKYPVETLVDKGGDCEDTCILFASLLNQFDYGSVLLIFREQRHMAVGVKGKSGLPGTYFEHQGNRYYYVETTETGWNLGKAPKEMQNTTAEIVPVNSNPVFVFSYAVDIAEERLDVEVQLKNVGDAPGRPTARVLIEERDGSTVASGRTQASVLAPQAETTVHVHPEPPADRTLRVRVQALLNGSLHDELTSEYQEPIVTTN